MILPGEDLVAAAETGSGKTAAFLLPILARLLEGPAALRALVLVPTRELAAQVEAAGREYARFTRVRVGAVYGGVPLPPQERMLRNEGVELLVATPGRLLDLHERMSVSLDEVEVLVLDEADRMVDMGFAPDLKRILKLLPRDRQTLMFSATMPPDLNKVAHEALTSPRRLQMDAPTKSPASIAQAFYPVPRHLKIDLLDRILERSERGSVIVFARTKRGAERLGRQLQRRGHDVAILHGDRNQSQRERAMRDFRRGRAGILVATDIASRGIDVDEVTHVVNFDVPRSPEDYVHRVGRTGRMGDDGDALTLVSPEERKDAEAIERFIGRTVERMKVKGFDYHAAAPPESPGRKAHGPSSGGTGGSRNATGRTPAGRHLHSHAAKAGGEGTAVAARNGSAAHGRRRRLNSSDRRSRRKM